MMKCLALRVLIVGSGLAVALVACDQKPAPVVKQDTPVPEVKVLETYLRALSFEDDAVDTRFGKLVISHSQAQMSPDTLLLAGKPVFQQEGFYLSLHYYLRQNERDIVLFGSNCGGTACPQNQFYYLILRPEAEPLLLTDNQFMAIPEDLDLQVDGGRLLLDLGYQEGKHKTATLAGDTLRVTLEAVAKSFLGEENCRWLYDEAIGACREYREVDARCGDIQNSFPGYLFRGIAAVAEHPGFVREAFERRCKLACETDSTVDYPTFAKEVCSK